MKLLLLLFTILFSAMSYSYCHPIINIPENEQKQINLNAEFSIVGKENFINAGADVIEVAIPGSYKSLPISQSYVNYIKGDEIAFKQYVISRKNKRSLGKHNDKNTKLFQFIVNDKSEFFPELIIVYGEGCSTTSYKLKIINIMSKLKS